MNKLTVNEPATNLLSPANEVWGKVIFSQASVIPSVHKGEWDGVGFPACIMGRGEWDGVGFPECITGRGEWADPPQDT